MTITTETTKAELITAIGRALMEQKRTEEAAAFYSAAAYARDAQEVLLIIPNDMEMTYATHDPARSA